MADNKFELGDLKFEALGDRIIIKEDEFKSGYECEACTGSGAVACSGCAGSGKSAVVAGARCSQCEGGGTQLCPLCQGRGGLLVAPETAQRRPTSGVIVSAGAKVQDLKVGDSVLYSNFAGYVVDLDRAGQQVVLRILHETEVLTKLEGHLQLRNLRYKSDIGTYTP